MAAGSTPARLPRPLIVLLPALAGAGVVLAVLYALTAQVLLDAHRARLAAELEADARRLVSEAAARWETGALPAAEAPCPTVPPLWVRIALPGDAPACAVGEPPAAATVYAERLTAARRAALEGRPTHGSGAQPLLAVTLPVRSGGRIVAALQAVRPTVSPAPGLAALRTAFVLGGLALAAALLGTAWMFRHTVRRDAALLTAPLQQLRDGHPAAAHPALEGSPLAPLAESLHEVAQAVHERTERIAQRLGEREAVLASMDEGVLAVEPGGRVLELNTAAGRMFGMPPAAARGRDLLEIVRNPDLQRFLQDAQASPTPLERELTLYGPEPRILEAHATVLRDSRGQGLGTLMVLADVTHLRRLERMRQDFVANVSHEIKTPITSIKGFVETLLDGAIDDPAHARRFLEIVARHTERLNAITEDLLNLSRVEQESAGGALHTEIAAPAQVLRAALALCAPSAEAKDIALELDCDPELRARLNPQLVEQAVVNLVDNAVKYAPGNTTVRVSAAREPASVEGPAGLAIRVADQGPGIPSEHLPRLFERFYRVDKARSRQAGGTGLGLAIVKHIAQAHGGRVEVSSRLGEGSTFTLHLPEGPEA